jgi:hypothetical protein
MSRLILAIVSSLSLAVVAGCSCTTDNGSPDGSMSGVDAGNGSDAASVDTGPGLDSVVPGPDGNGFDVGPGGCFPAACAGHQYQCGNCIDDDMDGLVDSQDPDCLNQCDNTETVFDLGIPGGDSGTCMIDCYYDSDQGPGNDGCTWNYQCDMLSPGDDGDRNHCGYSASATCPATQPTTCHDVCGPLTPNGCDCFGCCEITPGSGMYVYLGSTPSPGHPQCSPASLSDPESCRPCTPVADCLNDCGHCELCFGRDTLPPDCFPTYDGGTLPDGGPLPDGGMPAVRCSGGEQPCGLPGDSLCPAGDFCITGCCQFFG